MDLPNPLTHTLTLKIFHPRGKDNLEGFGPLLEAQRSSFEKVHAVVARSTFRSQNVQNTRGSDHFWRLRCGVSKKRCSQWLRSAIPDSQQPISPIGFLFLKLPPPPCAVLLVTCYYCHQNPTSDQHCIPLLTLTIWKRLHRELRFL